MNQNALWNCKNPHQGSDLKVLCVCSAGLLRSPTMANVLHKKHGYNTRACGVHDYALIQFNEVLGEWADEIVVADVRLIPYISKRFWDKTTFMSIPDRYSYNDPKLVEHIKNNFEKRINYLEYLKK